MPSHVILPVPSGPGWHVLRIDGIRADAIAYVGTETLAERIAVLLDRHGLEDQPLEQLPDTETTTTAD